MHRIPGLIALFFVLTVQAHATQNVPQRVDDLLRRASEFLRALSSGDRVKASEMVALTKRKEFLNYPPKTPLDDAKLTRMDFVDKDHVYLQVTGKGMIPTPRGPQVLEPLIS